MCLTFVFFHPVLTRFIFLIPFGVMMTLIYLENGPLEMWTKYVLLAGEFFCLIFATSIVTVEKIFRQSQIFALTPTVQQASKQSQIIPEFPPKKGLIQSPQKQNCFNCRAAR